MAQVTVSPKYQIVIPREIRTRLRLKPGQRILLSERNGTITAIPDTPLETFRGILKGMSRRGLREKRERM